MCDASMSVIIGDGASPKLWTNNWSAVGPLSLYAPWLFNAVLRAGKKRTVQDALADNRWARDITGSTTTQVLCDYLSVWELLRSVTLQPLQLDRFVWRWSSTGTYTISSTYRAFFAGSTQLLGAVELWCTKAPPRAKFFF